MKEQIYKTALQEIKLIVAKGHPANWSICEGDWRDVQKIVSGALDESLEEKAARLEKRVAELELAALGDDRTDLMRRGFKVAKDAGVDVDDAVEMRSRMSVVLGKKVDSRKTVSNEDWRRWINHFEYLK